MTDDECTIVNGSVNIMTVGSEEDKEAHVQGVMVPRLHHSESAYILTLYKK